LGPRRQAARFGQGDDARRGEQKGEGEAGQVQVRRRGRHVGARDRRGPVIAVAGMVLLAIAGTVSNVMGGRPRPPAVAPCRDDGEHGARLPVLR
jgi:hypothetical protein